MANAFQRIPGGATLSNSGPAMVWVTPSTAYLLYWASGMNYIKTTDGGYTWSLPVSVYSSIQSWVGHAVWFDQWTPGSSGTLIHMIYSEAGSDDILYRSLDISSDTLGTQTTVFNGASFTASAGVLSITRAVGGNLYVGFNGDGGTETGFYRSTDVGGTWASRSNFVEAATTDYFHLLPANLADTQDIWAVFLDTSANEYSLKTYDDSGNSWSETAITSVTTAPNAQMYLAAIVRPSDGHILFAGWTDVLNTNADILTYDITDAGTITAKTNVLTDINNAQWVGLALDGDGYVSCYYAGHEDESEATLRGVYRKVSTDGMATWSAQERLIVNGILSGTNINYAPHHASRFPLVAYQGGAVGLIYFDVPTFVLGRGIGRGM